MSAEILVLGGGFAGLAAVGELARRRRRGADLRVRLIDRRPYSLFSPMLPDLISGRARAEHLCHPLEPHCRRLGVELTRAEVRAISPDAGRVATDRGSFRGDFLILCLGCETNYFGDEQMKAAAAGLKSVREAAEIREAAAGLAESARRRAARRSPGHVVVVGGGYTGFEAASHLAHLVAARAGVPFRRLGQVARILIVEKADEMLRNCSPNVRRWAVELMRGYGVEVRTGVTVASLGPGGEARLSDGTALPGAVVVWAAGVAPGEACAALAATGTRGGRLPVDEHLRLPGADNVFAAGDVAAPLRPGKATPLRMAVQFSLAAGRCAAANVVRAVQGRPLDRFDPFDPGYLVPLTPGRAAGTILGREIRGRIPYALHYFMCVFRSWGWRNRAGVIGDLFGTDRRR